jgi:hypothetical protein
MGAYLRYHGLGLVAMVLVLATAALVARSTEAAVPGDTPRPVAQLPATVVAADGALTLYADHAGATLYLVNRTGTTVKVPAQDNDLYAKLEVEQNGTWQRAQSHVFSFCGNSYRQIALPAGHYLTWPAYRPKLGSPANVRYRLYGDLVAVSNAGRGVFDPAELVAARIDALAMQTGDVATIRAALFGPLGADRQSVRDAALRRLAKLPAATAIPVVEQFLATGAPDDNEYSRALGVLHTLDPARVVALVTARLREAPNPARERLVHELPFLPRLTDATLVAELATRARDPKSPDVRFILDALAGLRTPAIGVLLVAITGDAAYTDEVRQRARYLHEEWYGDDLVGVRVNPVGGYTEGHVYPVFVDIDIINKQPRAIHFEYATPADILAFYLTRSHGRELTFLSPRKTVRFFAPPSGPTKKVDLAPGQTHTIRIAVMSYFDLPPGGQLSVWASVKLPGLHTNAQLGGGGAGINPRRP